MRNAYKISIILGITCFLSVLYSYIKPEILCVMLGLATFVGLALAFVITAFIGFTRWRKSSRLWMMPMVICLTFLAAAWLSKSVGRFVADWQFARYSSEYLLVVDDVRNGRISCPAECGMKLTVIEVMPMPTHVRAILAAHCNNNVVIVGFLSDIDVPLVHEGYFYRESG